MDSSSTISLELLLEFHAKRAEAYEEVHDVQNGIFGFLTGATLLQHATSALEVLVECVARIAGVQEPRSVAPDRQQRPFVRL